MNAFKTRWQVALAEAGGSRLLAGAQTVQSLAEGFIAGYQLAMSRTELIDGSAWSALAVSEGFNGLPPLTQDSAGALSGSKTWIPAVMDMDVLILRVGRGPDALFCRVDLPNTACRSELRPREGFLDDLGLGMMHFDQLPVNRYQIMAPFSVRSFPLMEATSFFSVLLLASEREGLELTPKLFADARAVGQVLPEGMDDAGAKAAVAWLQLNEQRMRLLFSGWDQDQRLVSMYARLGEPSASSDP